MAMTSPPLHERARGRWHGILPAIGISEKFLKRKNGPCPVCGGKDRFRFTDIEGKGTFYCNNCKGGNGIALVMKFAVEPLGFPAPAIGSCLAPYRLPRYRKCLNNARVDAVGHRACRRKVGHFERGGTALQRWLDAFFHRYRYELLRVRDALVSRSDNALSHLRLGRRRT
jgi:primase-helicase-like zinc-binding protein